MYLVLTLSRKIFSEPVGRTEYFIVIKSVQDTKCSIFFLSVILNKKYSWAENVTFYIIYHKIYFISTFDNKTSFSVSTDQGELQQITDKKLYYYMTNMTVITNKATKKKDMWPPFVPNSNCTTIANMGFTFTTVVYKIKGIFKTVDGERVQWHKPVIIIFKIAVCKSSFKKCKKSTNFYFYISKIYY